MVSKVTMLVACLILTLILFGCENSNEKKCKILDNAIQKKAVEIAEQAIASTRKSVAFSTTCSKIERLKNKSWIVSFEDRFSRNDGSHTGGAKQAAILDENYNVIKINLNVGGDPDIWFNYRFPADNDEQRAANSESISAIDQIF